jgi:hypothetical protein
MAQCDIIRDVFGNAARPVTLEPAWLTRNAAAVEKLAQAIYVERAFGRLPELADALEKSGCHNERILSHCRSQGEHVRGCWAIDLLLSKERLAFPMGARMPLALPTVNY